MQLAQFPHLFAGSPPWLLTLAAIGVTVHIGAGGIGIVSGTGALATRKGWPAHRAFGKVFIIAMLANAAMASTLAAILVARGVSEQMSNVFGGLFAFYLIVTAWITVRRPEGSVGRLELVGFALALGMTALTALGLLKIAAGARPDNGVPVAAPISVFLIALLCAGLDLKVILRRGVAGAARIARHLWRMCVGMFIATGSFFIGQQQDMPRFMHGSPALIALGFAPILAMLFWLSFVALTKTFRTSSMAAQT